MRHDRPNNLDAWTHTDGLGLASNQEIFGRYVCLMQMPMQSHCAHAIQFHLSLSLQNLRFVHCCSLQLQNAVGELCGVAVGVEVMTALLLHSSKVYLQLRIPQS